MKVRILYALALIGLAVKLYDCQKEREYWRVVATAKQNMETRPYFEFDIVRNEAGKPMVRFPMAQEVNLYQ